MGEVRAGQIGFPAIGVGPDPARPSRRSGAGRNGKGSSKGRGKANRGLLQGQGDR